MLGAILLVGMIGFFAAMSVNLTDLIDSMYQLYTSHQLGSRAQSGGFTLVPYGNQGPPATGSP